MQDSIQPLKPSGPDKEQPRHLENLQQELYSREPSNNLLARGESVRQLGIRRKELSRSPHRPAEPLALKNVMTERTARRHKFFRITLLIISLLGLAVAAGVGTYWYRSSRNITVDDIQAILAGPEAFTSGDRVQYTISYRNDSAVDWENVELVFKTPPGFIFESSSREFRVSGREYLLAVGTLSAGGNDEILVSGELLAAENASVIASVEVTITPRNFPSGRFTKTVITTSTATAVPLTLAIDTPREATTGERIVATIKVTNTSASLLRDVYIVLQPNPGLELATEDPQFSPEFSAINSEWHIAEIASLGEVSRQVVLFVQGQANENRTLGIEVGLTKDNEKFTQKKSSAVIVISSAELNIQQSYNQKADLLVVRASDSISGTVQYANNGTEGLRDVIIKARFEGVGLDEKKIDLKTGSFDPISQTITWTSATVPQLSLLQPGQSGEIAYSFAVKATDQFSVQGDDLTNHAIIITASIDSPGVRVAAGQIAKVVSDRFVISIISDLVLLADSFYDDGRLGLNSTGPIPPKVDKESTYTVRIRLGSTLNDIGDLRVVAILPDGVRYTGNIFKTVGEVAFNERAGEIVWTMPLLSGLTGRGAPYAELHFQVAITPGANQQGDEVTFLNRLMALGTDQFTDAEVTAEVKKFPTTETAVPGKGDVE